MEDFRTNVKCKWVDNELIVARRNRMAKTAVKQSKMGKYARWINVTKHTYSLSEILDIYSQSIGVVFASNLTSIEESINDLHPPKEFKQYGCKRINNK